MQKPTTQSQLVELEQKEQRNVELSQQVISLRFERMQATLQLHHFSGWLVSHLIMHTPSRPSLLCTLDSWMNLKPHEWKRKKRQKIFMRVSQWTRKNNGVKTSLKKCLKYRMRLSMWTLIGVGWRWKNIALPALMDTHLPRPRIIVFALTIKIILYEELKSKEAASDSLEKFQVSTVEGSPANNYIAEASSRFSTPKCFIFHLSRTWTVKIYYDVNMQTIDFIIEF